MSPFFFTRAWPLHTLQQERLADGAQRNNGKVSQREATWGWAGWALGFKGCVRRSFAPLSRRLVRPCNWGPHQRQRAGVLFSSLLCGSVDIDSSPGAHLLRRREGTARRHSIGLTPFSTSVRPPPSGPFLRTPARPRRPATPPPPRPRRWRFHPKTTPSGARHYPHTHTHTPHISSCFFFWGHSCFAPSHSTHRPIPIPRPRPPRRRRPTTEAVGGDLLLPPATHPFWRSPDAPTQALAAVAEVTAERNEARARLREAMDAKRVAELQARGGELPFFFNIVLLSLFAVGVILV